MTAAKEDVPRFQQLINPTLRALHRLGGSASIQELADEIVADLNLPSDVAEVSHGQGSATEVEYRAAWARNYLKNAGLVENSDRGVWALTQEGGNTTQVDEDELVREVQRRQREARASRPKTTDHDDEEELAESEWTDDLLEVVQNMESAAFERLCQRLLREAGFIEVEVLGRSGMEVSMVKELSASVDSSVSQFSSRARDIRAVLELTR